MSTGTNTPAETTTEQLAAAKELVATRVATIGPAPAEAWEVCNAAWAQWPEDTTALTAAKKRLSAAAAVLEEADLVEAWNVCMAALKKPDARKGVRTGRPVVEGLSAANATKAASYIETGNKYIAAGLAILRGEEPQPIRNPRKGEETGESAAPGGENGDDSDVNVGDEQTTLETNTAPAPATNPAPEVAGGLDAKSAAALGVARTSPPTAEELAAVAAAPKPKSKK